MKEPDYFLKQENEFKIKNREEERQALIDLFRTVGENAYLMPEDKEDEDYRFCTEDENGDVAFIYAFCLKDGSLFFKADDEWGDNYADGDWIDIKEYYMEHVYATMYKIVAGHADMIKEGTI